MRKFVPFTKIPTPLYLCYERSNEYLDRINIPKYKFTTDSIWKQIKEFNPFKKDLTLKDFAYWQFKYEDKFKVKDDVLFYLTTNNQYTSLVNVMNNLNTNSFLTDSETIGKNSNVIITKLAHVYGLLYIPIILFYFFISKGYQKKSLKGFFFVHLKAYGFFHYFRKLFKKNRNKIKLAMVSNDHSFRNRAFFLAAHANKIPSAYLQHASVSKYFPELEFTYSFLDGSNALKKYLEIGKGQLASTCFLSGISKFDYAFKSTKRKQVTDKLGFCISVHDKFDIVIPFFHKVLQTFGEENIVVRPHPSLSKEVWQELESNFNCQISMAASEDSISFLNQVDAIITSASNIILEAALMHTIPLCHSWCKIDYDYYGLINSGIATEVFHEEEDLLSYIDNKEYQKKSISVEKAQNYCATFGTPFAGESTKIISDTINSIINKASLNTSIWNKDLNYSNLRIYRLKSK